jgi:predicted RND superfamily exporter protein
MDEKRREKEIEKRERLVQTFIIVGGFFVANATEKTKHDIILIFTSYVIITIIYYVFISRTRNPVVDLFAFISSILYSFIMLIFWYTQSPQSYNNLDFLFLFFSLTSVLTYALLSPEGNEYITNLSEKLSDKLAKAARRIPKRLKSA